MTIRVVYIVIKNYDENLERRQPWYGVKKLITDLKKAGCNIKIVPDISKIDANLTDIVVIKIFSLKDLFVIRSRRAYRLNYLITFPIYPLKKFLSFPLKTTIENWKDLKRIFIASLVPKFVFRITLNDADNIIVISDRSEKYLSSFVRTSKYITFIFDNWNGVKKEFNFEKERKTIGYFGPPFTTRSFDDVIHFFTWLNLNNQEFNKKIITRIERDELKDIEDDYLSQIKDDKSLKVISGFLDRELLARELIEIDILILPFKIVMSELPVVVLEALELGIPVVTTTDCGIERISKGQKNILILKDFEKDKYNQVIDFIESVESDDFHQMQNSIDKINKDTLSLICQK